MSTKLSLIRKLKKRKEYRDEFVAAQISTGIPFQIRALRKAKNWSQEKLAEATRMLQPRICAMEQAGYGDFTLNTLKKLASAFDVGLVVRFAPYGELVNWADNFSPDTFGVPSSKDDPILNPSERRADAQSSQGVDWRFTVQLNQIGQAEGNQPSASDATLKGNVAESPFLRKRDESQRGAAAMAIAANGV